jgi:ubiquitin-conjugating enzyme E2 J2
LPDPSNVYEWYYIVFGLEAPYKGGYYIGKIKCKETYPATAPNITIYTDNGKFRTNKLQPDGICLSISDFHQESWNPAWKVTQIVMGLVSFWLDSEYTYGSVESYDYKNLPFR